MPVTWAMSISEVPSCNAFAHGVTVAMELIRKEMDIGMALYSETDIAELGRHNPLVPERVEGQWV